VSSLQAQNDSMKAEVAHNPLELWHLIVDRRGKFCDVFPSNYNLIQAMKRSTP
jgi:hypothetical protein